MRVRVQAEPFDLGAELAAFARGRGDIGAVVTFTGVVRDAPAAGWRGWRSSITPA
jgi:molybdopterin synthase catalytic subunit